MQQDREGRNQDADQTLRAGIRIREKNFELMDSLYKAAVEGYIDQFRAHASILDQILTPKENTILHIHITARPPTTKLNSFWKIGLNRKSAEDEGNFVGKILDMCPDLLWKANTKGETLLHIAARHGHADIAKDLIDECKKPHQNDPEKCAEAARMMLLAATNESKDTAFHEAVRHNQVDVVKLLTKEDPRVPYDANEAGETPLYLAAERGYKDVMKDILSTCKSPADHGPMGRTALHAAVFCEDEEMTKMLLDFKKTLTSKPDQQGWLPLHLAAHLGCYQVLKELLNADKSAAYKVNNEGNIALHLAAGRGKVYSMLELIQSCPSCCEITDNEGWNVFHFAVYSESRKAVQFLLNNHSLGNLVNEKNDQGKTPLLEHAASGSYMKSFICHPKVDKLAFNNENRNAIDTIMLDKFYFSPNELFFIWCLLRRNGFRGRRQIEDGGGEIMDNEGITMPGGYIDEKGPDQGTAVLTRSRAFQGFVISNSAAMVFSSCAVFAHLFVSLLPDKSFEFLIWNLGQVLIVAAMVAMVLAFLLGAYAVLYCSAKVLAVIACVIVGFFFSVYVYFLPLGFLLRLVISLVYNTVKMMMSGSRRMYLRFFR
ncbi:serine/threonine-protein phosphatase 6 regulatory ankyrin repeat subunit C isoform X2 [Citrus clementina]|uniref:serine/threonine-protein phosphatase 6 regulatory ankyrin repeat subunit C isoform X2 n=1 Tax=Citrus clementina TaxID=85681 RepID=UPI000CED6A9C|nr:serine/threonine-protein phosphatase 6 regulatory ankyrin repeat subunit C isoform X2 [Citrus x clementina]